MMQDKLFAAAERTGQRSQASIVSAGLHSVSNSTHTHTQTQTSSLLTSRLFVLPLLLMLFRDTWSM
jgi:hypothetical protein